MTFKQGDLVVPKVPPHEGAEHLPREILYVGERWVVYKLPYGDGTYKECVLLRATVESIYVKHVPFFEAGKTYRGPAGRIFEVYRLDELDGVKYAYGKQTYASGQQLLALKEATDFNFYEEEN